MRKLNAKQKAIIKGAIKQRVDVYSYDDLTYNEQEAIDKLNCFECLPSEATRFIGDFNSKQLRDN